MTNQQGIRKAALFLNGLDREAAGILLKRLPAEEARAIRREMIAVEGISPSEINKTVRQFLKDTEYVWPAPLTETGRHDTSIASKMNATVPGDHQHITVISGDGIDSLELSGQTDHANATYHATCESINIERDATTTVETPVSTAEQETVIPIAEPTVVEPPVELRRFDYLERRSAFDTAEFLAEEGEQLIAVVLSQLTPRYSGDVLACFEQSLKRDLIRRLVKLDATDETILDEIDEVLKDRLIREVEDRSKSKPGLVLLERILQVVENELDNTNYTGGTDLGNDILSGLYEIDMEEQQAAYYDGLQASGFGIRAYSGFGFSDK